MRQVVVSAPNTIINSAPLISGAPIGVAVPQQRVIILPPNEQQQLPPPEAIVSTPGPHTSMAPPIVQHPGVAYVQNQLPPPPGPHSSAAPPQQPGMAYAQHLQVVVKSEPADTEARLREEYPPSHGEATSVATLLPPLDREVKPTTSEVIVTAPGEPATSVGQQASSQHPSLSQTIPHPLQLTDGPPQRGFEEEFAQDKPDEGMPRGYQVCNLVLF